MLRKKLVDVTLDNRRFSCTKFTNHQDLVEMLTFPSVLLLYITTKI